MPKRPLVIQDNVIIERRQLLKIGRSHYISIPKEFIEIHGLKGGDWLPTSANLVFHIFQVFSLTEHKATIEENNTSKEPY